jgi:hypothetical protein
MSSGGSSKTTNDVPKWVQPYAKDYLGASQRVASQPYQPFGKSRVATMNPYETAGYNAQAQRAQQGSAVNAAASGQVADTLSGKYLGAGNPYLSKMIDSASNDVNRNYDVVDQRGGSFGNTGVAESRTKALGEVATNMRGQAYESERNRQLSALGQASGIANQDYVDADRLIGAGQGFRGYEQQQLGDEYSQFDEARNYPREQLGILGQGLGMNYGGSSTSKQGSNPWNAALGAAASYYGGSNK